MTDKVQQYELDRAKKLEKISDNFLTVTAVVTVLIIGGLIAWGAWLVLSLMLPVPELFWSVIGVIVLGSAWAIGLGVYNSNHDIVERAERYGVIDE